MGIVEGVATVVVVVVGEVGVGGGDGAVEVLW